MLCQTLLLSKALWWNKSPNLRFKCIITGKQVKGYFSVSDLLTEWQKLFTSSRGITDVFIFLITLGFYHAWIELLFSQLWSQINLYLCLEFHSYVSMSIGTCSSFCTNASLMCLLHSLAIKQTWLQLITRTKWLISWLFSALA